METETKVKKGVVLFLIHRERDKGTGELRTCGTLFLYQQKRVPGYPESKADALAWSWISEQLMNLKVALSLPLPP